MRIRMLWLGSIVLGALVIGMPRVVWSHGGGGGGGGGHGGGGGGGFGGGGHGGGFGGGGHGGFGGGFGGGHHGGGFGGGYHGGGFGGGYHGGGVSGGHHGGGFSGGHHGGGFSGGYHGGGIGGSHYGGTHIGGAPSIGGSHHSGNIAGAARHNTNTFTQRHIATPTRTVTQGFRGVTSASHLGGTHAQSLLNHRAGLTTGTNAPFLRNHHLMGQNGFNHHNGLNHRNFGSSFFGFGFPFFGFGFWPYGYGYGGYGGYGYGGYGYGGYGGYGYGYPYYNYGNYGVAQTTDATLQNGSATDAQVFAEKGEADFKKGDYKGAVYAWRHAALDDPQNGVIHMMLAQALFATGQFDEAAGATQHAMQLLQEEQWGVVVTNYRELYGKVGAYTSQLRVLEKAVKQKPDDPATRFLLGFHYAYLGYPSHAVKQLDKTVSLVPRDELAKKLRDLMVAKLPNAADAGPGGDKPAKDPDDGA